MTQPLPLYLLPDSVHDLISIIDVPLTLVLIEARAGREITIPTNPKLSPWLIELIGLDAVTKLSDVYSGEKIDIPRCVVAMRAVRDKTIYADKMSGETYGQLATKYGFTERGIRKVIKRAKQSIEESTGITETNPQASLF